MSRETGGQTAGGKGGNNLGHGDDDDKFVEDYERLLSNVRWVAVAGNGLYSFNRFIGFCALTWSMAVVLGAILTSISKDDYYFVALLLLLEAVRLSVTRLFRLIVLQKVFYVTTDPRQLVYHSDAKQKRLFFIRCTEQVVQLVLVFASLILSVMRLLNIPESPASSSSTGSRSGTSPSPSDHAAFNVYVASLRIFYWLVLINAFVSGILSFFKPILLHAIVKERVKENPHEMSLLKYHDHIVWMGTQQGFVQSCADVDILSFAFQVQAEEYRSNVRAAVVMKHYRDLMRYLCCHPRFKGFEKAAKMLESADPYEVEAAANVIGCWVRIMKKGNEYGNKCKTLMLQRPNLLRRLADTLAHEESGRAATSSFEALAEYNPEGTAQVRNSAGSYLADILIDMIHDLVVMGKPDKAVVLIKVCNLLLPVILKQKGSSVRDSTDIAVRTTPDQDVRQALETELMGLKFGCNPEAEADATHEVKFCKAGKVAILLQDLVQIVTNTGVLKRTQAVAAYGLVSAGGVLRADGLAMEGLRTLLRQQPRRGNGGGSGREHTLTYEYDCIYYVIKSEPRDPESKKSRHFNEELGLEWISDKIELKPRDPLKGKETPAASENLTRLLRLGPACFFCFVAVVATGFLLAEPVSTGLRVLFFHLFQ